MGRETSSLSWTLPEEEEEVGPEVAAAASATAATAVAPESFLAQVWHEEEGCRDPPVAFAGFHTRVEATSEVAVLGIGEQPMCTTQMCNLRRPLQCRRQHLVWPQLLPPPQLSPLLEPQLQQPWKEAEELEEVVPLLPEMRMLGPPPPARLRPP